MLREVESVLFLSLLGPVATLGSWIVLPVVAVRMAVSYSSGETLVAELGEYGLAAVASGLGVASCLLFWRDPASKRGS
jgi:hypothetical protein